MCDLDTVDFKTITKKEFAEKWMKALVELEKMPEAFSRVYQMTHISCFVHIPLLFELFQSNSQNRTNFVNLGAEIVRQKNYYESMVTTRRFFAKTLFLICALFGFSMGWRDFKGLFAGIYPPFYHNTARNTVLVDPHGVEHEKHVTSRRELAKHSRKQEESAVTLQPNPPVTVVEIKETPKELE